LWYKLQDNFESSKSCVIHHDRPMLNYSPSGFYSNYTMLLYLLVWFNFLWSWYFFKKIQNLEGILEYDSGCSFFKLYQNNIFLFFKNYFQYKTYKNLKIYNFFLRLCEHSLRFQRHPNLNQQQKRNTCEEEAGRQAALTQRGADRLILLLSMEVTCTTQTAQHSTQYTEDNNNAQTQTRETNKHHTN
jgi:hypothetical protein